jgi:hypothetical protein
MVHVIIYCIVIKFLHFKLIYILIIYQDPLDQRDGRIRKLLLVLFYHHVDDREDPYKEISVLISQ